MRFHSFFWLISPDFARQRVAQRVSEGGHNIPSDIIERRFYRGIFNLFNLYLPIVDNWLLIDNGDMKPEVIARGARNGEKAILNNDIWELVLKQSKQGE